MKMSSSTGEITLHSTRRKSCTRCIKSKRRCDLASPACSRCLKQDRICRYSSRNSNEDENKPPQTRPNQAELFQPQQNDFSSIELIGSVPSHDVGFDLSGSLSFMDSLIASPSSLITIPPVTSMITTRSQLFSFSKLSPFMKARYEYLFQALQAAPSQMVLENQTPWCHMLLYEDSFPRIIGGMRLSLTVIFIADCVCGRCSSSMCFLSCKDRLDQRFHISTY